MLLAVALLEIAPAAALDVTRFGAVPDDGKDDTEAFLAAVRALSDSPTKRLVIPRGRYQLRADGNPARRDTLFPITGVDGLTLEGRGAELMMSGEAGIFGFASCSNVSVSGITVDWQRPPFSEGTVIATAARSFDVRVAAAYPVTGGEPVGAFMTYHPDTGLPDGRDLDVYQSVERTELVAPQVLRVHLTREIFVPMGKLLVLRHQVYGHNAFVFNRCRNVQVSDVTVFTCPGMALVASVCTDVALRRVNVRIRPGSGRLMSVTADATHFGGCMGTVSYQDCVFEGMGDDGANIKSGLYLIVRSRVDARTVLGQHNLQMTDLPDPGDMLELSHVDMLAAYATGKVRSARLEPGEGRLHRIEFSDALPDALGVGDVLGNATRTPRLRMSGCTVRGNRARGVLCQTRDAVIENCTFKDCTGPGVLVLTEAVHFFESIGTRDVTVRDCRFENCNAGAASAEGALCAVAYLKDYAYPKQPGVHRDVRFVGNRITNTPESAIFAVAVDGLTLRGNTIEQACLRAARPTGSVAIQVLDSIRVTVAGNTVDPALQGKRLTDPVRVR